ncbi:MAG TPA: DUF1638 domain-containing protein [Alphaproteobacteria bacterium]|nr:DUF1638 domain-containing protein [Alphaproteobacteria bacterium]
MRGGGPVLLIACGALAREITAVVRANRLEQMTVECLPAKLHNTPALITEAVRAKIRKGRARFGRIFVLYGDCGTGGALDAMLAEEGVERIQGAHCYEFFAGTPLFAELSEEEPCSFYLTDFLARHFGRLVIQGLGIDRHPELLPLYFGNYKRLVYLAQVRSPELEEAARAAAARLGLAFELRSTGYGDLERALMSVNERERPPAALSLPLPGDEVPRAQP